MIRFSIDLSNYIINCLFKVKTDILIITFYPSFEERSSPPLSSKGWGEDYFPKFDYVSFIGVIPKRSNWYREEGLVEFFTTLKDLGFFNIFSEIITYGSSMGGYGCLAYADYSSANKVISINPQASLSPQLAPWEKRYKVGLAYDWENNSPPINAGLGCINANQVFVIYDPFYYLDKKHVDLLKSVNKNIIEIYTPFLGHGLPITLTKVKILQPIVENLITGFNPSFICNLIKTKTRELPIYFQNLLSTIRHREDCYCRRKVVYLKMHSIFIMSEVELINPQKISGWVLDLEENEPTTVEIRINGIKVIEKLADIERLDVKKNYEVDIPTGFEVYMKEIVLPSELKELPDNAECRVEVYHKRTGKLIQGSYRTFTAKELKNAARLSKDFPYVMYVMDGKTKEFIELVNLDTLLIDVLKGGRLILGGLLVIKKEFNQSDFKLMKKDAEGEKEVVWFQPSPGYAQNNPENPNAKKARYRVESVVIDSKSMAELYLTKGQEKYRILEVKL